MRLEVLSLVLLAIFSRFVAVGIGQSLLLNYLCAAV